MKCSRCGGEMTERVVKFCSCNAVPPILIENVPALVCGTCGGEVFSDATVEVFEKIRDGAAPRPRIELMRVYDFDRAAAGEPTADEFMSITFGLPGHTAFVAGLTSTDPEVIGLFEGTAPLEIGGGLPFIFQRGTSIFEHALGA